MNKRSVVIFAIIAATFLMALLALGCGDTPEVDIPDIQLPSEETADDLNKKIEELGKREMTVEIIEDGETMAKWTQDGKGSWRSDDPEEPDVYTIFNAKEDKIWSVDGDTATELDASLSAAFELGNPIVALSAYSSFAFLPRTGGSDDVWEWDLPGEGGLRIEFKGPDGLISKVVSEDESSGSSETEFKYSNVDDVPASTFELPDDVTVESIDGTSTSSRTTRTDSDEE